MFPISCHTRTPGSSSSPATHLTCWLPRNLRTSQQPLVVRTQRPISVSNDYCCFKVCLKCLATSPPAEILTFSSASAAPGWAAFLLNDAPPSCGDAGGDDTMVRCPLKAGHNWCRQVCLRARHFSSASCRLPSFPRPAQLRPEPLSGPERARTGRRCDLQPILSGHLSLAANPAYQRSALYQGQPH